MTTEILPPSARAIRAATECLSRSDVVALPTETVYGLAGVATDTAAVERIFGVKERPSFDPLIVHVSTDHRDPIEWLEQERFIHTGPLDRTARMRVRRLADAFWPGPLTLVLPVGERIPGIVTSGLDTVAIRAPRHPVFRDVIASIGKPLAAPSANRFGRISPTRAGDVFEELAGRIPLIIDGGPAALGLESTVARIEADGGVTLLRSGGLAREPIEAVIGCALRHPSSNDQSAPGRMTSHYAPGHVLRELPCAIRDLDMGRFQAGLPAGDGALAILIFQELEAPHRDQIMEAARRPITIRALSEAGDDREVARNLFLTLRELDRIQGVRLFVEPVTRADGLWPAILERLVKAMG